MKNRVSIYINELGYQNGIRLKTLFKELIISTKIKERFVFCTILACMLLATLRFINFDSFGLQLLSRRVAKTMSTNYAPYCAKILFLIFKRSLNN